VSLFGFAHGYCAKKYGRRMKSSSRSSLRIVGGPNVATVELSPSWGFQYWWVVVPLTLVSSALFLSKPKPAVKPEVAEKQSNA
jgi:hypothetical protein